MNSRKDVENYWQSMISKKNSITVENYEKQLERQTAQKLMNFEEQQLKIDDEIEHLMLYFTSDKRKTMVDYEKLQADIDANEKIISKRNKIRYA